MSSGPDRLLTAPWPEIPVLPTPFDAVSEDDPAEPVRPAKKVAGVESGLIDVASIEEHDELRLGPFQSLVHGIVQAVVRLTQELNPAVAQGTHKGTNPIVTTAVDNPVVDIVQKPIKTLYRSPQTVNVVGDYSHHRKEPGILARGSAIGHDFESPLPVLCRRSESVRVVISAYACDPQGGSEALNGWRTAEAMAQLGHQVVLLTRPTASANIRARADELGPGAPTVIFVPDHIASPVSRGQFGIYARYAVWQRRALRAAQRQGLDSFDLVHHVSWGSVTHPVGLAGLGPPLLLGPVGGGQFVHPAHERWLDGPLRRERYRRAYLQHLARRSPTARRLARSASMALATNPETARLLYAAGAPDVREMLAEAVSDEALAPRLERGSGTHVLWVGRFLPIKGARLALETFVEVLRRTPSARLRMVGDGPTMPGARRYASEAGIAAAVEFTGSLTWAAVQKLYTQADISLFTSIRDSSGAQVLEAAAKGLPTIALRQSGVGRWLPAPAGNLVDPLPGDDLPLRLADAVVSMFEESPAAWMARSSAAYEWAAENTWTVRAQTLSRLYQEIA
jgi:glycosyltransferase involved in cell wall biosynthesis